MSYFKNVSNEMKKVTWSKGHEVRKYLATVIWMVVFCALYFALTDFAFDKFINWFINL